MRDNRRRSARKGGEERGLLRNGQENGLRSRGLVHPEHALCLAELSPDKIGRATDAADEQVTKERFLSIVTLFLRLEDGVRRRT